jgi:hypothetical protein
MDSKIDNVIEEFKKNIDTLHNKYFIGKNGIYKREQEDIVFDNSMNKDNDIELINFIKNKLNIVDKIEKDNISEYRTGADKILEPDHTAYSYKLTIHVDNKIFYEYIGTTDDFKYGGDVKENNKLLLEIMENKRTTNIKLLINSFVDTYQKLNRNEKIVVKEYIPKTSVVYGGKKN